MLKEITPEELAHAKRGDCLVEFYTPTCAFCKEMEKTLIALAEEKPEARLYKMDVSEENQVARDLKIRSVPTLVRFKNGEVSDKLVGSASKDEIAVRFMN